MTELKPCTQSRFSTIEISISRARPSSQMSISLWYPCHVVWHPCNMSSLLPASPTGSQGPSRSPTTTSPSPSPSPSSNSFSKLMESLVRWMGGGALGQGRSTTVMVFHFRCLVGFVFTDRMLYVVMQASCDSPVSLCHSGDIMSSTSVTQDMTILPALHSRVS